MQYTVYKSPYIILTLDEAAKLIARVGVVRVLAQHRARHEHTLLGRALPDKFGAAVGLSARPLTLVLVYCEHVLRPFAL